MIGGDEAKERGRLSNGGVGTRGGRKGVCRRPSPHLLSQSQPSIAAEPVLNRGRKRLGGLLQENDVSEERPGSVYDEKKCDVAESVEQAIDVEGLKDEVFLFLVTSCVNRIVPVFVHYFNETDAEVVQYLPTKTRAGYSRVDQYYVSYPAKLYKQALGYCFEMEDWGPIEWCVMADHFDRQGKAPYEYHALSSLMFLDLFFVLMCA
ncbi:hypothetical protein POM88_020097 [Heracleum sosnowskyi]|uniref:Uncharacterized protein n=1 Tax=Heracleum sosnowskyi TaxID=360622 RepID=A0AAD8ID76_9APIA|nr:hypothetical protein POM88_020097 [Heracleum sosnowskyi]